MIERIEREKVPPFGSGCPRSPMRQFAFEAVGQFLAEAREGDVYEVTGCPAEEGEDGRHANQRLSQALNTELHHLSMRRDVRVFRRGGRLFMERRAPATHIAHAARGEAAHPGDTRQRIEPR